MLKKFMIICVVFSFVFIGGIAFASAEQPPAPEETQTEGLETETISEEAAPSETELDVSAEDSETTVAEEDELKKEEPQEEAEDKDKGHN